MAEVTAKMVQELRERTGSGMMECKRALVASEGNIDLAIEEMRKSGQLKAAKKASRIAAEGLVVIKQSNHLVVMMEVNCETDFVARDASFKAFVEGVVETAFAGEISDLDTLLASPLKGAAGTVDEVRKELIGKLGENLHIRRLLLERTTGHLGSYCHGGRIGAIVSIQGGSADLARDLAMHVAASRPSVICYTDMPHDIVAKEKEIIQAQLQDTGKPPEIVEKMAQGRLQKFLEENALEGQAFIKNPDMKVGALLKQASAQVLKFSRFEVGEGIEKQTSDFAAEVMSQIQGS